MEESTFWILAAVGVVVFIFIFLEPISAMFEDELENEEEKRKYLLKNTTDDYLNSVLESAGIADIVTKKKAVVNRPHKKTGNWKIYIDYHLSHPVGVNTKLLYQVEDEVLNRKLKNENIEVNLKPKLTEKELQNISKIKAERTNSFWFNVGAILITLVLCYYIYVGLLAMSA